MQLTKFGKNEKVSTAILVKIFKALGYYVDESLDITDTKAVNK